MQLTMNIFFPACRIPMSCEAEFLGSREMFSALLRQEWLHSQANKTSHKCTHSITNRQKSQCKFSLLGRNVPRNGMGRVQYNHPCDQAKSGAESDDYPDVRYEMVPRLKQEEDQMRHFQYCIRTKTRTSID